MNRREKEPIDFVITWVDGNDPKWQEEKDKTLIAQGLGVHIDGRKERYRDWDNLQYWFRVLRSMHRGCGRSILLPGDMYRNG